MSQKNLMNLKINKDSHKQIKRLSLDTGIFLQPLADTVIKLGVVLYREIERAKNK